MVDVERHPSKPDGRTTRSHRTESLVSMVHKLILEDIITGKLKPGTIAQLSSLAEAYEVSRTPVREALGLLEREGFLVSIPYKGFLIRQIEPADVHDVFLMRQILETSCLPAITERISEDEIERLSQAPIPTSGQMTRENEGLVRDFHRTLISAAGSPRLEQTFAALYNDIRRIQYSGIGAPRADLAHVEHIHILDALRQRDPELAEIRMREHLDLVYQRTLETWLREPFTQNR